MDDNIEIEEADPPTPGELSRISSIAMAVRAQQRRVIEATAALQEELKRLRKLEENDLPEALIAVGLSDVSLTDGTRVQLKQGYHAGKLTSDPGLSWVEEHGGSSLIKTAVMVEFDRGDYEAAKEFREELRRHPKANLFKSVAVDRHVHQSTLSAWVRELVDAAKDPPLEVLGVHRTAIGVVGGKRPKTVELKGLAER